MNRTINFLIMKKIPFISVFWLLVALVLLWAGAGFWFDTIHDHTSPISKKLIATFDCLAVIFWIRFNVLKIIR